MDLVNIGKRYAKIRFQLWLSQIEFAKSVTEFSKDYPNTDQRKISRIERGEQAINGKLLHQLREQYDVSSEWLMHGIGEMFGQAPKLKASPEEDWRLVNAEKRIKELEDLVDNQKMIIDALRKIVD